MAKSVEEMYMGFLVKTLEQRQLPNLTPMQKRKFTKHLKHHIGAVFGYDLVEYLPQVDKMVKANNWVLTAQLLEKLLRFAKMADEMTV